MRRKAKKAAPPGAAFFAFQQRRSSKSNHLTALMVNVSQLPTINLIFLREGQDMNSLRDLITAFSRGITRSKVSLIGAMVVTVTAPFLIGCLLYDLIWHIDNTYFSAAIYMLLGPVFMGGLSLVFLGLFFFKGKEEVRLFTLEYLRDYFTNPKLFNRMRKLVFFAVFLTGINLFIFGLLGYRGYHYMESVSFCGQFCHQVMAPEFTAYSNSPHSRVPCVECHIGSGATWFVKSKISGMRQLFAVALETYPRPIETPVHGLRPARDTCEECHRPEKFHGDKLRIKDDFLEDEASTQVQTVLLMKIGSAGDLTSASHGIHWHVSPENRIVYKAEDHSRTRISEVTLEKKDGTRLLYRTQEPEPKGAASGKDEEIREMDCIDCHNRPTHIYLSAPEAINNKILSGEISRELPFIKKKAIEAVTKTYSTQQEARKAITTELTAWYRGHYPEVVEKNPALLQRSVATIGQAYAENVFPEMGVEWDTYGSFLGHKNDSGCFRCHDDSHQNESGETISMDCDTCHTILAERESSPAILKTLRGE